MAVRDRPDDRRHALAVLGLRPGASELEVRAAHRRLALRYHPDVAGGSGLERFLAVQAAFEDLVAGPRGPAAPAVPAMRRAASTDSARAARAVHRERRGRVDGWYTWTGQPTAREGPAWGAEPGWKGGLWYWEDIARRAERGVQHRAESA